MTVPVDATRVEVQRLFLGRLFPEGMPGTVVLSAAPSQGRLRNAPFTPGDIDAMVEWTQRQEEDGAVGQWASSSTTSIDPELIRRKNAKGGRNDACAVAALNADLDGLWGKHSETELPATVEDILPTIEDLDPTMLFQTGGGMLGLWMPPRGEWWDVQDDTDRATTQQLARDLNSLISDRWKAKGWVLDNTANLDRLIRIAGTLNWKTGDPRSVERVRFSSGKMTGSVYDLGSIRAMIPAKVQPRKSKLVGPKRSLGKLAGTNTPSAIEFYREAANLDDELLRMGFTSVRWEGEKHVIRHPTATNDISGNTISSTKGKGRVCWLFSAGSTGLPEGENFDVYEALVCEVGAVEALKTAKDLRDYAYQVGPYAPMANPAPPSSQPVNQTTAPGMTGGVATSTTTETLSGGKLRASIMDLDSFFDMPEPVWLIDEVLRETGLTYLTADPGMGKSFVALEMAVHLALGRDYYGRRIAEPVKVFYLASEDARGLSMRLKTWIKLKGQPGDRAILLRNLHFSAAAPQALDPVEATELAEVGGSYDITIVDTQADITSGVEENNKKDMDCLMKIYWQITEVHGKAVLVLHHPAAGGWKPRGIGSQLGKAEGVLNLFAPDEKNKRKIILRAMKMKNGPEGRLMTFLKPERGEPSVLTHVPNETWDPDEAERLKQEEREAREVQRLADRAATQTARQIFVETIIKALVETGHDGASQKEARALVDVLRQWMLQRMGKTEETILMLSQSTVEQAAKICKTRIQQAKTGLWFGELWGDPEPGHGRMANIAEHMAAMNGGASDGTTTCTPD